VAHDAGRLELGAGVDDAADRALRRDGRRDGTARVDGLDLAAGVRAVDAVEVPPRDAVLGGDDGGVLPEERVQQVSGPRNTKSTGPISAGSSVAGGCASKSPRSDRTFTPFWRMASRFSPRAMRDTSVPPRARAAPT
jgi:hypothetical protein